MKTKTIKKLIIATGVATILTSATTIHAMLPYRFEPRQKGLASRYLVKEKLISNRKSSFNRRDPLDSRLINAIHLGRLHAIIAFLKTSANVNATCESGHSALYWACQYNHIDIVKALVIASADITSMPLTPAFKIAVIEAQTTKRKALEALLTQKISTQ